MRQKALTGVLALGAAAFGLALTIRLFAPTTDEPVTGPNVPNGKIQAFTQGIRIGSTSEQAGIIEKRTTLALAETGAQRAIEVLSSNSADSEAKLQYVDPIIRGNTPVERITRIEIKSALTQIDCNYYTADGSLLLAGSETPILGKLFFTYVGEKLVLTPERAAKAC